MERVNFDYLENPIFKLKVLLRKYNGNIVKDHLMIGDMKHSVMVFRYC